MDSFSVKFWGVRGSIACPGEQYARYGGNTSCLEVRCGERLIILDAGTGLRELGHAINSCGEAMDFDIYLTHTHLDHIAGVPFFGPLFDPRHCVRFHAGHLLSAEKTLQGVICHMMSDPLFPVPPEIFGADVNFLDFPVGQTLEPHPDVTIRTAPLNHPNGATGYRIEFDGRSICYVTDTEHYEGRRDPRVLNLIEGSDLVIYDCSYSDEEYPRFKGWGHSTWQEGIRLVEEAGAKRLAIFHHDPMHNDDKMDEIAAAAEKMRAGTLVAREGLTVEL